MFPSERTQPSLDQMPSFELQSHIRLLHPEKNKINQMMRMREQLDVGELNEDCSEIRWFGYNPKSVKPSQTQPYE